MPKGRLQTIWNDWVHLCRVEIWRPQYLKDRTLRGHAYAVLRVISITLSGLIDTNAASRAAALSFSSLLGLGPLVSIAVLVAGFAINNQDPDFAAKTLNRLIHFVAPQIAQYEEVYGAKNTPATGTPVQESERAPEGTATLKPVSVNPQLVEIINGFIAASRNGAVGVFGTLTLIVIVLQLFTSIETAFNEIWGVRRGRSWLMRIVFYWTVLTLGAVLFFVGATGLSASAFINAFAERLNLGEEITQLLKLSLPLGSILLFAGMLTLFYRTVPNTRVLWSAALVGAVVVTALVLLNNFLAFLYFRRVILNGSLYGSLAIGPILMFGLYVFWLFVLLGGTVSYAVQNVHFRNSQAAWGNLSETLRERLTLLVLLSIGRRFNACQPPRTASELSESLKVPTQIVNECLNRLVRMNLVTPIPAPEDNDDTDFRYQPARPLSKLTLREFKDLDDGLGGMPTHVTLTHMDPVLREYHEALADALEKPLFSESLEKLFAAHPFEPGASSSTSKVEQALPQHPART